VAVQMGSCIEYLVVYFAAIKSGLYFVPLPTYLRGEEVTCILNDCEAKLIVVGKDFDRDIAFKGVIYWDILEEGERLTWKSALVSEDDKPKYEQCRGQEMLYSSGSTGAPKGIKRDLPLNSASELHPFEKWFIDFLQLDSSKSFLIASPIYHAGPLKIALFTLSAGATCILMEQFNAEWTLDIIEQFSITHAMFVPTMFARLLDIPKIIREKYDVSSLSYIFHTAASCPVGLKERMIEWVGPILYELYGGTESVGATTIGPIEWLAHKGSVGKPFPGSVSIRNDVGLALPSGEIGIIYFNKPASQFEYHNNPRKTAEAAAPDGAVTYGDIGYLDNDDYLFIVDRRADVINVGGIKVYPQEIENMLILHPGVYDVAVVGVQDEIYGQKVKAYILPKNSGVDDAELERSLREFCKERVAAIKCPAVFAFTRELPRTDTGKLLKRKLNFFEG